MAREQTKLTLEEARATLANQKWRLRSGYLYNIRDKDGNKVVFKPNRVQKRLFDNLHNKNIIVKGRQQGMTTFIDLFLLDIAAFNANKSIGIIAHTEDSATDIFNNIIKFAFDNLPADLKESLQVDVSKAGVLKFSNGSSISVGTSFRSGTLQYLHISEYGKICARRPDKAREIQTGALPTLGPKGVVFIESTAEGDYGQFYTMCKRAMATAAEGRPLNHMEYKFFFFPWRHEPSYSLDDDNIALKPHTIDYFNSVMEGTYFQTYFKDERITEAQMRWYQNKKANELEDADMMTQEFPCTPDEAFANSVKGAYYDTVIARLRRKGKIGMVPFLEKDAYGNPVPAYSAWDIGGAGGGDDCVIWFFQIQGKEVRVFDYWEGTGMSMVEIAREVILSRRNVRFKEHFLPHDAKVHEQSVGKMRIQYLRDMGMNCMALDKTSISDGIDLTRNILKFCVFDMEKTSIGVDRLSRYSRAVNKTKDILKDTPDHSEHSHAADAFRYLSHAIAILLPDYVLWNEDEGDRKPNKPLDPVADLWAEMERDRQTEIEQAGSGVYSSGNNSFWNLPVDPNSGERTFRVN